MNNYMPVRCQEKRLDQLLLYINILGGGSNQAAVIGGSSDTSTSARHGGVAARERTKDERESNRFGNRKCVEDWRELPNEGK